LHSVRLSQILYYDETQQFTLAYLGDFMEKNSEFYYAGFVTS